MKGDEFDNIVEIVLKSTTQKLWDITDRNISKSKVTGFVYVRKYESTGSFYTFVRLESATFHKSIPELFHLYKNILKGSSNIETKIELSVVSI